MEVMLDTNICIYIIKQRPQSVLRQFALSLGVRLITNNEREFKQVPGLRVENWI